MTFAPVASRPRVLRWPKVRYMVRVASIEADPRWCLVLDGFDANLERAREVLAAIADGRIGLGGAPLVEHDAVRRWAYGNGVYDGNGPETHLLAGPVGFHLPHRLDVDGGLRRVVDLRAGVVSEEAASAVGVIRSLRFCSLARPGVAAVRIVQADGDNGPVLQPSTEGTAAEQGRDEEAWMAANASTGGGIVAVAVESRSPGTDGGVTDRVIAYETDARRLPDRQSAARRARDAAAQGFEALLDEQRTAWGERWDEADVVIEGDEGLQLAVRYALFHLMASVPDVGEAAVGARGLTGPGYRGHVFWDADAFVLPFLAATHPASARAMLEYRVRRLGAAQQIARRLGRAGARFPWESAESGYDVTPRSARDRTGRVVPIRSGQLEEHVTADVAWAASCYLDWTGDEEFAQGPGLRLFVETARYWASRVTMEPDGSGHIYGVIGPDEYHEPVDDNAFTNVMARWNLRRAAEAVAAYPGGAPDVEESELARWRTVADALVDGYDDNTGVYEQCAGFYRLEPLLIAEIAPRRPITADLLLGADRVAGAQVVKQADVLMLHHLVPDEVVPHTLEPNLRFYEPRTAHGSSLSPAVHAALFARARDHERALDSLRIAAFLDRDDLTGTTANGLHLATMGGLWQALAFGFAGVQARPDCLRVDPHVPPGWGVLELRLQYHGAHVRLHCQRSLVQLHSDRSVTVEVSGVRHTLTASGLELARHGVEWRTT